MTEKSTSTKSRSRSAGKSSTKPAAKKVEQPKPDAAPIPKGAPGKSVVEALPSPLNEVDDGKTDNRDLPDRNQVGEPDQPIGGDKSTERGRLVVPPPPAQPEVMHNRTRRTDQDALHGHAVEILEGDHKGRFGIFEKTESYEKNGLPKQVIVSLKNVTGYVLSLPYKALRHVPHVQP